MLRLIHSTIKSETPCVNVNRSYQWTGENSVEFRFPFEGVSGENFVTTRTRVKDALCARRLRLYWAGVITVEEVDLDEGRTLFQKIGHRPKSQIDNTRTILPVYSNPIYWFWATVLVDDMRRHDHLAHVAPGDLLQIVCFGGEWENFCRTDKDFINHAITECGDHPQWSRYYASSTRPH